MTSSTSARKRSCAKQLALWNRHRLQAQQGDPRDRWMLRMVLVEACRGTAHEGEIEKVDLDTAT
eukprot:1715367-Lingulodinium_polyedra.AAC.1